jgi:Leucine-rich repeat (LRR) protein
MNQSHIQRKLLERIRPMTSSSLSKLGSLASITIQYTDEKGMEYNITRYADKNMHIDFRGMQICGNIVICECKNAENIRSLDLCDNQITKIGGFGLDHLTNLQELGLGNNKITEIKGLDHLTNLQILYLHHNKITEIKGSGLDHLTNLQTLWLTGNQITKIGGLWLDYLTNLQVLGLGDNKITVIKGLDHLTNLQTLWLNDNQITAIKGLDHLTNLQVLNLYGNSITEIKGLDHLTNLQVLGLYGNKITKIKGLDHLTNLQILWLCSNRITEIRGLDHLTNLQELWLSSNAITEVPNSIMNLRNLKIIYIDCKINQIIQRFLNRNNIKSNNTTYTDGQNVHDSQIVKSVQNSIYAIIQDVKQSDIDTTLNDILKDDIVSKSTKAQLVEYCEDKTVHSLLNLTFGEILVAVWKVIVAHKDSKEIKEILNGEMSDSMCKCFTGRISRLVNSLNGFDDRITIKISDSQEILNVIINVRNKYTDIVQQKTEIIKELTDRGYDMTTINEYIVYLE